MKYHSKIHEGIFELTLSGDANLKVYDDAIKTFIKHKEWKPGGRLLIEESKLNTGSLTVEDIRAIADLVGQYQETLGNAKVAIIVSRDLEFGMTRMVETFVEIEESWYGSSQIFWNKDEALAWLQN